MKRFIYCILLVGLSISLQAQADYQPTEGNLKNREWFRDAKFGLFIHWGVYSQMAGAGQTGVAEWVMEQKRIPVNAYEKLPTFFNPTQFDPEEWVRMVKAAGMKYITITSKHHDGFAMYHSEVSDYNIVDGTPYGKDVLKQLKEACDKHGIKLFFYYSQLDWHHPDYYPTGRTGNGYTGRPDSGDWDAYIEFMNTQLTELLTNYGEIGGIWLDGMWDKPNEDWQLDKTYSLIHELQPDALIGSNHHKSPFPGEDFQMFERDLPGENTMGFNQTTSISDLPLEMCETMNGSWGYNLVDKRFKSVQRLVQTMVKAAGFGANFLLNTGPMPNGKIQTENIDTLMQMGKWLEKYGETIYGTRRGPIGPSEWWATTATPDGKTVYLHILKLDEDVLFIPDYKIKPKKMTFYDGGEKVRYQNTDYGLMIEVPDGKKDHIDTIVKIEF